MENISSKISFGLAHQFIDYLSFLLTSFYPGLLARHGNDDTLRFPAFYEALLKSSHHPADNNGRIKVIIDEGFVQLSNPNSFDRVLTVVGFSWHHVPQGTESLLPLGLLHSWPSSRVAFPLTCVLNRHASIQAGGMAKRRHARKTFP